MSQFQYLTRKILFQCRANASMYGTGDRLEIEEGDEAKEENVIWIEWY